MLRRLLVRRFQTQVQHAKSWAEMKPTKEELLNFMQYAAAEAGVETGAQWFKDVWGYLERHVESMDSEVKSKVAEDSAWDIAN